MDRDSPVLRNCEFLDNVIIKASLIIAYARELTSSKEHSFHVYEILAYKYVLSPILKII